MPGCQRQYWKIFFPEVHLKGQNIFQIFWMFVVCVCYFYSKTQEKENWEISSQVQCGVSTYTHHPGAAVMFNHKLIYCNAVCRPCRNLFPCGDSMVCIIDDREDVWKFAPNLVTVRKYVYFKGTGDINAPPGSRDALPAKKGTYNKAYTCSCQNLSSEFERSKCSDITPTLLFLLKMLLLDANICF